MDTDASRERWDSRSKLALAGLVALCVASLAWLVHPWYEASDETNDASIYIACARSLLAGEGYTYLDQPFAVRPPGWSVLVAGVLALRGLDFQALNLLSSAFGILCTAFVFVHARARVGTWIALPLALGVWLHDGFQRLSNQPMSDVAGAALLFVGFALERWAARRPSWQRDVVLGLAIGASTYVRSVVILFVPAIVLARVLERWHERRALPAAGGRAGDAGRDEARRDGGRGRDAAAIAPDRALGAGLDVASAGGGRAATRQDADHVAPDSARSSWLRFALVRVLPLVVAVVAIKLPWDVRNAFQRPPTPVEQNYLLDYSTAMWRVDGGDPTSERRPLAQIADRIPERTRTVAALLGSGMRERDSVLAFAAGALALALVIGVAWKRRSSPELFALLATGVLLVYFGFRDRLVLPIYLVALVSACDGVLLVARRAGVARSAAVALAAVLWVRPLVDFHPRAGWDDLRKAHELYVANAEALTRELGPDARVATVVGWHWSVYLDRPVWSTFFVARRSGDAAVEALLERLEIDAVIVWPRLPSDRAARPWFERTLGAPGAAGEVLVYRTRR